MRRRPFHAERTSPAARYFISNLRAHRNLGASHALTHLSAVRSMRLLRASSSQTTPMPRTWCKRPTAARSRRFRPAAIESISAMCSAGAEATTVPLAVRLAYVLINRRDLGQLASRGRLIARPAAAEADYRGIRPPKRCPRLGRIQGRCRMQSFHDNRKRAEAPAGPPTCRPPSSRRCDEVPTSSGPAYLCPWRRRARV